MQAAHSCRGCPLLSRLQPRAQYCPFGVAAGPGHSRGTSQRRGAASPTPRALGEAGAGLRAEAAPGSAARLRQPAPTSLWQLLARSRHHTEQLLQGSCCRRQRHQTLRQPRSWGSPVPCPLSPPAALGGLRAAQGAPTVLVLRAGRHNVTRLCFTRFEFQ